MSQSGINSISNNSLPSDVATSYIANTGMAVPVSHILDILGSGSITTLGSGNTLTVELQGLTNHSVLLGTGTATITSLANGTTGQVLTATTGANPSWQTPGGGGTETLTGNDGGIVSPTGGTIPVLSAKALTTVNTSYTYGASTTDLYIEDRTYLSQYVVDPSTSQGTTATFQTIQAALDKIASDGTGTSPLAATIIVRDGTATYATNLTVAAGQFVNIYFVPYGYALDFSANLPTISGTITVPGSAYLSISNANISGDITSSSVSGLTFNNCYVSGNLTLNSNSETNVYSSLLTGTIGMTSALLYCFDSQFTGTITDDEPSNVLIKDCLNSAAQNVNGTWIVQNVYNTSAYVWTVAGTITGQYVDSFNIGLTGSGYVTLSGCTNISDISGASSSASTITNSSLAASITATANINYSSLSTTVANTPLFSSAATQLFYSQSQGNILQTTRTAVSYDVLNTDYYIGVTDTSAARTITLIEPSTLANPDQVFTVMDESGGAGGAHHITVSAGGALINGVASLLINTNYGSLTVTNDGTNYFAY